MPEIYQIVLTALFCAFIILVTSKNGLRYKAQSLCATKGLTLIAQMLDCDFCFGFWLSVIISSTMFLVTMDTSYIFVPVFSAPLTRFLI